MRDRINHVHQIECYDYAISLGWFCGVASGMRMTGIRSFSSPFDWIYSDFPAVLKHIDDNFSDFLVKQNMVIDTMNPKRFKDNVYQYYFMHDVVNDFESEFNSIYSKYERRIKRFMEAIHYKTCFFRAVKNDEEIAFIESNTDYINSIIKKYNVNNKIVYILLNNMKFSPDFTEEYYRIDGDEYTFRAFSHGFKNDIMISKLCENIVDPEIRQKNLHGLSVLLNPREVAMDFIYYLEKSSLSIISLINKKINMNSGLYVWGAGDYGNIFAKSLRQYNVKVKGFIDNNVNIYGQIIMGIPVLAFKDIVDNKEPIFIAIADNNSVKQIASDIYAMDPERKVFSFEDFRNEIIEMLM